MHGSSYMHCRTCSFEVTELSWLLLKVRGRNPSVCRIGTFIMNCTQKKNCLSWNAHEFLSWFLSGHTEKFEREWPTRNCTCASLIGEWRELNLSYHDLIAFINKSLIVFKARSHYIIHSSQRFPRLFITVDEASCQESNISRGVYIVQSRLNMYGTWCVSCFSSRACEAIVSIFWKVATLLPQAWITSTTAIATPDWVSYENSTKL